MISVSKNLQHKKYKFSEIIFFYVKAHGFGQWSSTIIVAYGIMSVSNNLSVAFSVVDTTFLSLCKRGLT